MDAFFNYKYKFYKGEESRMENKNAQEKDTKTYFGLTGFEAMLWLLSVLGIIIPNMILKTSDNVFIMTALIGVTALIFVAKGKAIGQILTIIFSVLYGVISYKQCYYGEMITYLGMTAPMAFLAWISWLRHPDQKGVVKVAVLTVKQRLILVIGSVVVTLAFFVILKALGTASLLMSSLSITTSFIASYLTACRSRFYALAYALNDLVLIVLWSIVAIKEFSYLTMVICFVMFLLNDLYGLYNWKKMHKAQLSASYS